MKAVGFVHTIVSELSGKDVGAAQDRSERVKVFIGLHLQSFGNGADITEQLGANGHAAGAEESATTAKQERSLEGVGLKTEAFTESLGLFASVKIDHHDSMAHNSDRRIGVHGLHDAGQFIARPPIVAIEK